jgi:hypothetical protein
MLLHILTFHQVMPSYLVFGTLSKARDLRFSGFREQTLLSSPPRGPAIPELHRSGRYYQLCYNLKSVAMVTSEDTLVKPSWSIRQAAFHHQFDIVEGNALWIVAKGDREFKMRVQELTGKSGRVEDRAFGTLEECFRSSLAVHLLFCHWSTEEWRWYLQWLEDTIDGEVISPLNTKNKQTILISYLTQTELAILGLRDRHSTRKNYTPTDLQNVQYYEDKTNEAIMALEANVDVLKALRYFYETAISFAAE